MSMIRVEGLTFSYPGSYDDIFENVSLQIDTDWRLGLVGRNGRGKTTFLRLLMGDYEYQGRITSSVCFDYFPYAVHDMSSETLDILMEHCPQAEEWELIRELSYLDMDVSALYRPFETLSNGEQTKALLAALFLNEGHFLLIDEPTNHLDSEGRLMLASYLKRKRGFILVSHDRRFLDGCIDHVLSINRMDIELQKGDFSVWFEAFEKRKEAELARNLQLRSEISRLKSSARRTADWSDKVEASKVGAADKGYVGHMAAKLMKRSKSIEQRQQKAIEERSALLRNVETAEELKLSPLSYRSQRLASLNRLCISCSNVGKIAAAQDGSCKHGINYVCGPLSFTLDRGDRIFLDGRNGSGKSSLLKLFISSPSVQVLGFPSGIKETKGHLIFNEGLQMTGELHTGSGLIVSYVPQDCSFLSGDLSELTSAWDIDGALFRAILRKMGFDRVMFEKDTKDFSAGQKKKVLLAKSLCESAHLYIWDEPLNYIDIYSRMQIEDLIKKYRPTMLLVEHDTAFREGIATKIVSLRNKSEGLQPV